MAKRSSCTKGQASTQDRGGQPHHGTLSGWSPCVQLARPIGKGLLGFLWQGLSIQNTPPQFGVIGFVKELLEFRRIGWFKLTLAQSSVLQSHNHKTQDWICPLGLAPVIYGHASDLQTIPYWVQDTQIGAICFNGAWGALMGGLLHGLNHHCNDPEVDV